jgi:hypothetical protein
MVQRFSLRAQVECNRSPKECHLKPSRHRKVVGRRAILSGAESSAGPYSGKRIFFQLYRAAIRDLVDPGEGISSDDTARGKSSRRPVFMAASDDSAILVYEQGGVCNVVAFWFPEGGRDWQATVEDIYIPTDPAGLRSALVKEHFTLGRAVTSC